MKNNECNHENSTNCYKHENESGRYRKLNNVIPKELLLPTELVSNVKKVRCVCISDTHNKAHELLETLPDGDILIHCGDFTLVSSENEIKTFNEFLDIVSPKYKHIIVIAGNHDFSFDEKKHDKSGILLSIFKMYNGFSPFTKVPTPEISKQLLSNCIYLEDEMVEIMGIKFYGSPWQPVHFGLGFNLSRGNSIKKKWDQIPNKTDILITHGPPLGIGDKTHNNLRVGCRDLLHAIQDNIKPKYHLFGHIHENNGIWKDENTIYINAATVDQKYNTVHEPVVFDYIVKHS